MKKRRSQRTRPPFTYTFGEFIDRLCILSKKSLCRLPGADAEIAVVRAWCKRKKIDFDFLLAIVRLAQTNMDIWHLEHSIRNAAEGSMSLSEIGRRATMIRNTNRARVEQKNILDRFECVEEKIKHLSEDTYDNFYSLMGLTYRAPTIVEGGHE